MPYGLPAAGQAVEIGTNTASAIRPAGYSGTLWAYSLFKSFGSGTFVPDFSSAGAFVIAGSGGHNAPGNVDAAVFDFLDATWKRVANTNGVPPREGDYVLGETNGAPRFELLAATAGQVPPPSHLYGLVSFIPASKGGGPRGSFLKMGSAAALVSSAIGTNIHKMDLATGLWTRVSDDTLNFGYNYEAVTVYDPQAGRYYFLPDGFHAFQTMQYLDLADMRVKSTPAFPYAATPSGGAYQTVFLDPVRRLLVAQRPGNPLRALDLNDIAAGWTILNTAGTQPDEANRWEFYPADGRFYTRTTNGGQTLYRLTPPSSWKTGTWTVDTVTVSGAVLPDFTVTAGTGVRHYGTFFYVPAIQSFAWISGESTQVVILKPPAATPVGP